MPTSISFLREPDYGTSVVLFVLSPPGIKFDPKEIGKNLYGKLDFDVEAITVPGLAARSGFRFSEVPLHWPDFLELAFHHADRTLFFIPGKQRFQEIKKESLLQQNPDLYAFAFYRFTCEEYIPEKSEEKRETAPAAASLQTRDASDATAATPAQRMTSARKALDALLAAGWSANAVSKVSGLNPVTVGSIRNGKQDTVSERVHDMLLRLEADFTSGKVEKPERRTRGSAKAPATAAGVRSTAAPRTEAAAQETRYVAVDAAKLEDLLDRLIITFSSAIEDLAKMRKML